MNLRLTEIAKNKYRNEDPIIEDYRDLTTLNVIDAFILYRLVTKSCLEGGQWIFDICDDENKLITIEEIISYQATPKPYEFDMFVNFLTNNRK